jgi:hypothetical protein
VARLTERAAQPGSRTEQRVEELKKLIGEERRQFFCQLQAIESPSNKDAEAKLRSGVAARAVRVGRCGATEICYK